MYYFFVILYSPFLYLEKTKKQNWNCRVRQYLKKKKFLKSERHLATKILTISGRIFFYYVNYTKYTKVLMYYFYNFVLSFFLAKSLNLFLVHVVSILSTIVLLCLIVTYLIFVYVVHFFNYQAKSQNFLLKKKFKEKLR